MKQLYSLTIAIIFTFCFIYSSSYSQIVWTKNSGVSGSGNFTITGTGSISSLNTASNIAFAKHGSGSATYYTCDNCVINIQITGQLIIDYPVYVTSTHIIVGETGFDNTNTTSGLSLNGSSSNNKQGLFLDNASSLQVASPSNFIKLQSTPLAHIYYNYSGAENGDPVPTDKSFSGTDNSPLCGLTSPGSSSGYTCNKGQVNGPAILSAAGFNVIAALPVVLVDLSANFNNNKSVDITWSTQMEVNLSRFTVQRSADGANWDIIGSVPAVGNSQIQSNYSFVDQSPLAGFNYYRLIMTDLDNKSGITAIESVRTPIISFFSVFPNPTKDYVDITLSKAKNGSVRLINQFGQILQQKQINASSNGTTLSFQLLGYAPGNYFVQVIGTDGSQDTGKLVITR